MSVDLHEAIERLRPAATIRTAVVQAIGKPSAWRGRKEQREHQQRLSEARAETQAELIREARRCGMVSPYVLSVLIRWMLPIVWEAIKYWLNSIHPKETA